MTKEQLEACIKEIEKISSVDDMEAPPGVSLNPRIAQAWKLKRSSWTDIGPDTVPNKAWKPKVKTAEPPPPEGVSPKDWDTFLQTGEALSKIKARREGLEKKAGAMPEVEAYVTGPSAAGKTTFVEKNFPRSKFHILQSDRYRKIKDTPNGRVRTFDWPSAIKDAKASGKPVVVDSLDVHGPLAAAARQKIRMVISKKEAEKRHASRGVGLPGGASRAFDYYEKKVRPEADRMGFLEKRAFKLQGHTDVQGIPVAIENRKGSVRKGKDSDGKEWRTKMVHPYGYIPRTAGADGEPVDAYIGPDKESPNAFVVHQHKDTGRGYDEDKVMLAFKNKAEAKKAYLKHYDSPKFLGPIKTVPIDRLKELIASKRQLIKIAAEKKLTVGQRIRKAGPGVGGLVSAGVDAILGQIGRAHV